MDYVYQPLKFGDIRVLDVQPGDLEDEIRFLIVHISLLDPELPTELLGLWPIRCTLPSGWDAYETPEGRYLYRYDPENDENLEDKGEKKEYMTTWQHPDPGFDPDIKDWMYELEPDQDLWEFEPCFEALSYVWGSPDNPDIATIEDEDGMPIAKIPINKNLASALRHLRWSDDVRRLWVDAICINQLDDDEKAIQVSLMRDIYRLASRVVAWLGNEDNNSALAISTLAHLGEQVELSVNGLHFTSPDTEETDWHRPDVDLPYNEGIWKAIVALARRPWFLRMWTAQEIHLANRLAVLQCGDDTISWALFRRAIECIDDKDHLPNCHAEVAIMSLAVDHPKDLPFPEVFNRYYHRQCSNPHDKYGLLGLMPAAIREAITVDYTQPYAETYKNAFLVHSTLINRWELFGCDTVDRSIEAPSWVADRNRYRTRTWTSVGQLSTGSSELHMQYIAPNNLKVEGLVFATIESMSDQITVASPEAVRTIRSWIALNSGETQSLRDIPLEEVYATTLAQGCLLERYPDLIYPTLQEWRQYCKNNVFSNRPLHYFSKSDYLDDHLLTRCEGCVLIKTSDGHVGLGPNGSQKGDLTCVVLGCDQPLVLRPLPNNLYHFVGNCYMDALQDANTLLGPLPIPWRVHIVRHPEQECRQRFRFFNEETEELTDEDPRLQPLDGWTRIPLYELDRELTGNDPQVFDFFRSSDGQTTVNSDPRLSVEALKARGLAIKQFDII